MLRNLAVALILGLFSCPAVFALGLGPLQSNSYLNEAFEGRIEILGATAEDFDSLNITLASQDQFERAGVNFISALYQLKFEIETNPDGKDFVVVTSRDSIREPFLNFLVEMNWAQGRLLREYTVLLDPPLYDTRQDMPAPAPEPAPVIPTAEPTAPEMSPEEPGTGLSSGVISGYATGDRIGPVVETDTLWSLASRVRPDDSVSVQQMMLALLRENPDAFGENNINLLRRGAVLRMPEASSITALNASEAIAEVRRQHQLWEEYRGEISAVPSSQPVGAPLVAEPVAEEPEPEAAETPEPEVAIELAGQTEADSDARLELVAPVEGESGTAPGSGAGDADLLREEIDARAQQAADLEGKLTEAEEIIDLLQRQVNLKDDELAALQVRLAELGIDPGEIEAAGADVEAIVEQALDGEAEMSAAMSEDDIGETETEPEVPVEEETAVALDDEAEPELEPVAETQVDRSGASESAPRTFPESLIPEHLASAVPGGALAILGLIAVVILGLFAAVIMFLMKSRDPDSPATEETTSAAVEMDDTESEDATITAGATAGDDDSEATTEIGADVGEAEDFDPNSTQDASGADEFDPYATVEADDDEATIQAEQEAEDDPLEELNVYLAYERFDQAEELVTRVIGEYPDRHEYKLRLLEVYYSSNDRGAYETAARQLLDAVGEGDPLWENAVAMWSAMSPERALFEEGEDAAPVAEEGAANAFVDITGDAEDEAPQAGEDTVAHAPGSDDEEEADVDFDLAAGGDEVLDLTATTDGDDFVDLQVGTDSDDVLDLSGTADDGVLDLTATADGDEVLDLTETAGGEVLDITGTATDDDVLNIAGGDDGVLDLTARADAGDMVGGTDAGGDTVVGDAGDSVLDLTDGGETDLLDVTASGSVDEVGGDDLLDLGGNDDTDLLDVTKTGDISSVDDGDLLNVTSPGIGDGDPDVDLAINTDDEESLEITDITTADEPAPDFDISETVATAFDDEITADGVGDVVDLTADSGSEAADAAGEDLEFDIGDFEDAAVDSEAETVVDDGALDIEIDGAASAELDIALGADENTASEGASIDFDITMDSDALTEAGGEIVETEDDAGRLEITMSSADEPPEDDLSLQGSDLDSGDNEFDFALDGTAEMDSIAQDETLDMGSVVADGGGLDLGDAQSLDDLAVDLDAPVLDNLDIEALDGEGELDIEGFEVDGDLGDLDTVALDGDDLPDLEEEDKTVVMPVSDDVERQSDVDEADTKLNLAKAYMELGDSDGARSILNEVAAEGSDDQKVEAQSLLSQL